MFGVGVVAVVIGLVLTLSLAPLPAGAEPTAAKAACPVLAVLFLTVAAAFALLAAITPDHSVATNTHPATRSTRAPSSAVAPTSTPGPTR